MNDISLYESKEIGSETKEIFYTPEWLGMLVQDVSLYHPSINTATVTAIYLNSVSWFQIGSKISDS